jgi:hypothetical protein
MWITVAALIVLVPALLVVMRVGARPPNPQVLLYGERRATRLGRWGRWELRTACYALAVAAGGLVVFVLASAGGRSSRLGLDVALYAGGVAALLLLYGLFDLFRQRSVTRNLGRARELLHSDPAYNIAAQHQRPVRLRWWNAPLFGIVVWTALTFRNGPSTFSEVAGVVGGVAATVALGRLWWRDRQQPDDEPTATDAQPDVFALTADELKARLGVSTDDLRDRPSTTVDVPGVGPVELAQVGDPSNPKLEVRSTGLTELQSARLAATLDGHHPLPMEPEASPEPGEGFQLTDVLSQPVATIELTADDVASRLGVRFERSWDGAEFVRSSRFDVPEVGRLALVAHGDDVEVHVADGVTAPTRDRLATLLGLSPADFAS